MNWSHIRTVWLKEILDTIRDRRTLIAGILAPVIVMPLISLGSQALIESSQRKAAEERTPLAILGAEAAPNLVGIIERSGAFEIVQPADPRQALRDGEIQLLLRIPPGFEREAVSGSEPAELTVEFEASKLTAAVALDKLRRCLEGYIAAAQAARLGLRDPGILQVVRINEVNVSTPKRMAGMLMSYFVPFTLAIWGIMGGMYTAVDGVAGEKERRTLEILIVTPPTRASLAAGKCLAVLTMSSLTILLSLLSIFLSFHYGLPLIDSSGQIRMAFGPGEFGLLFLIALPYLAMLSGLMVALSAFGRGFKETQNYFSILMFAVMLPGMALGFMETEFPLALYAAPFINAVALFKGVFAETWRWSEVAVSVVSNLLYFAATLALAQRMMASEKVLFRS